MKTQSPATRLVWKKALASCADPERAGQFLETFAETSASRSLSKASAELAHILCSLFSGSEALSRQLIAHADWLSQITPEQLEFPRRAQGLRAELRELTSVALEQSNYSQALTSVRTFKQREMLRVAARDLAFGGRHFQAQKSRTKKRADRPGIETTAVEVMQNISDIADVCLETVWDICWRQHTAKVGEPWHQDLHGKWRRTNGCVLAMGKFGGQELNYSSDIDVLFVYAEEGGVSKDAPNASGKTKLTTSNHQFFNRLAELIVTEIGRMTNEGPLYRIDLRLRPEGDGGPLTRSLTSYENYYAQWGQTWERMMLIKTRGVAGDKGLAAEFLEMIQPFRYPHSINRAVLGEVAAMKDRIENEVVRSGELERNVKLGRGGIREIEFIAQSLQLLHAGRQPFLQAAQTLPCLEKLTQYELLEQRDADALREAYPFLRDLEHRLQMENNLQTHSIPNDKHVETRLALLMGFPNVRQFETAHMQHRDAVRAIFERTLKRESPQPGSGSALPPALEGYEAAWKPILGEHNFRDVEKAWQTLREFVYGPGFVHVSQRTTELAFQLVPRLLSLCPGPTLRGTSGPLPSGPLHNAVNAPLSDPDRVLTRLDTFIAAYGARGTLFELWHSTPTIFELLIKLFDRSEFLAELAIRTPDLVDELVTSERLRQRKSAAETLTDLRHGIGDKDQHLWIRRYHQAELTRIGLRDILGLADQEQYLTELSALAEACLQYATEVSLKRHRIKTCPFAVIGLGKLGGQEIDYGSDLDIVFVAENKTKNLPKLVPVARDVMDLLSARTEAGAVFETDARLRPDGEKGLLVNTLEGYEEYYRQRAMLWEIQSLSRARFVAGSQAVGKAFEALASTLTDFRGEQKVETGEGRARSPLRAGLKHPGSPDNSHPAGKVRGAQSTARPTRGNHVAAFTPDWKEKIHAMRLRIEKERTPAGKDALAIKTGNGGLMDSEFLAQAFCMENGWHEPNTLRALERAHGDNLLDGLDKLIGDYRLLRRLEGILRRWSYEGEIVLPDDPAPYYRVAIRCGFGGSDEFRAEVARWRKEIREVYLSYFAPG
jgi:glutamate-ammonia-ligase adenylyltransferase